MRIHNVPEVGFITRSGRRIYGQDEIRRYQNLIKLTTLIALFVGLVWAIGREF